MFEQYGGPLTPAQRALDWPTGRSSSPGGGRPAVAPATHGDRVADGDRQRDAARTRRTAHDRVLRRGHRRDVPAVLRSGAGRRAAREEETGTLGRLIGSRARHGRLLIGKWLFIDDLGALQLVVMFAWGMLVFHLPLDGPPARLLRDDGVTAGGGVGVWPVLATIAARAQQLSGHLDRS